MELDIREFTARDTEQLAALFYESVRVGAKNHYTQEQREAWARQVPEKDAWQARLKANTTFVAEYKSKIAGFMTLHNTGHIDLAFVRSDLIGRGIGWRLYQRVEAEAELQRLPRLFTEASEMAKPLFERSGWRIVETQQIIRHGVVLTNHRMEKLLC